MICQKCGLQEATVHLETSVFRQKVEEHLCALCAGARKPEGTSVRVIKDTKDIELSARIELSDYLKKLREAEQFLNQGFKVRLRLKFRGQEMAHTEIGFEVIKRAAADLAKWGRPTAGPKLVGRNIYILLTPSPPTQAG